MKRTRSSKRLIGTIAALAVVAGALLPAAAASATVVPANAKTLAQQLVNSGRVSGETEAWAQLTAYASGTMRSHVINGQTRDCSISPVILSALKTVVLDRGFSIKISSLNRYCINQLTGSGTNSYHWRNGGGNAVDISVVNGVVATGSTTQDRALINAMFTALPGPAGLGQLNCHGSLSVPTGWVQFDDSCNHNHFEYRGAGVAVPSSSASFDVNSDGKADLLAVSKTNSLLVYKGNGSGGWASTSTLGSGWGTTASIIHGDYNRDGKGDMMAIKSDGRLWFYEGDGATGFSAAEVGKGWATFGAVTGGVDFNGDGMADLIGKASDAKLYMYPGNGAGAFGAPVQYGTGWSATNTIVAGDFTGDGRGDILARNDNGRIYLYAGNGSGLNSGVQVGTGWGTMSAITGGLDYNGDGKADVFARDAAGDLWLYPGLGAAGFGTRSPAGSNWTGLRLIS